MIRKFLRLKPSITVIIALFSIIFISPNVYAVDVLNNPGVCQNPDLNGALPAACAPTNPNVLYGPGSILELVVTIISVLIGIIAVVSIIVSGVRMITANGDPNSISSAKKGILYALVGLMIALVARLIVSLVVSHTAT